MALVSNKKRNKAGFTQSQPKGVNAALDLVEDALDSLHKKVQEESVKLRKNKYNEIPVYSSDTNSGKSSKSTSTKVSQLPYKETSVLLKRKSRASSGRYKKYSGPADRHGRHKSDQDRNKSQGKHKRSTLTDTDITTYSSSPSENVLDRGKSKPARKKIVKEDTYNSIDDSPQERRHISKNDQRERSRHRSEEKRKSSRPQETNRHISHDQSGDENQDVSYTRSEINYDVKRGHKFISEHNFAQPTLTAKLRGELQQKRRGKKQNITPFIPCGSKGQSHHVGVVVQQQLGHINTLRPNQITDLARTHTIKLSTPDASRSSSPSSHGSETKDERKRNRKTKNKRNNDDKVKKSKGKKRSTNNCRHDCNDVERIFVSEATIRRALSNIQHHIDRSPTAVYNLEK